MSKEQLKDKLKFEPNTKTVWICFFLCLILGAALGYGIAWKKLKAEEKRLISQIIPVREHTNYGFINPLLSYSIPNNQEFNQFQPLENKINAYIKNQIANGQVSQISVYFRDLNAGRWTGVNENMAYNPASMLKVALMIAYYKQTEQIPDLLSHTISYTKDLSKEIDDVPFQTPSNLVTGKSYTVEQLIEAMIINSDNGAKNALLANIDNSSLNAVYTDLGLQAPSDNAPYTISAKNYSLFFRILYNASYLNQPLSEKALEILNQAVYNDGLVGGVPVNTRVAHKFGEHITTDSSGNPASVELHDCGIIYPASNPYILCVMTKGGTQPAALSAAIKGISDLVYREVISGYK